MPFEIPLTNEPSQRFEIELDNNRYFFLVKYNYQGEIWSLTIEDFIGILIEGICMLPGRNILSPHPDIESKIGQIWLVDLDEKDTDPDGDNLGTKIKMIYYTPEESPNLPTLTGLENGN
jgi:hypothetical protein